MFADFKLQLSSSQALTVTAVSTNKLNLGAARNLGIGTPMAVQFNVIVAASTGNADETYQFDLRTDATDAMGSPITIASRVIARATLVAGFRFAMNLPSDTSLEEILDALYTLGGTDPTITVDAHLVLASEVEGIVFYPSNSTLTT